VSLELTGIRWSFPESEWRLGVDRLLVPPGDVLVVIGPNGSGKSTLLRIAAGILRPREGRVLFRGSDIFRLSRAAVARRLGYLPQETRSDTDFTVTQLVRLGRYPHTGLFGGMDATDHAIVRECLAQTGLEDLADRPLSRLSGGERKRAFLASVLAQKPDVLLLDEPTASLDLHHQVRFFRLLRRLARTGLGIAVVTHDINFAALYGDRLLFLHNGRVLAWDTPDTALRAENVRAAYGDSVTLLPHPSAPRPAVLPLPEEDERP